MVRHERLLASEKYAQDVGDYCNNFPKVSYIHTYIHTHIHTVKK